jgi:hypothetical protein
VGLGFGLGSEVAVALEVAVAPGLDVGADVETTLGDGETTASGVFVGLPVATVPAHAATSPAIIASPGLRTLGMTAA